LIGGARTLAPDHAQCREEFTQCDGLYRLDTAIRSHTSTEDAERPMHS
jgi:hypothetical protein